MGQRSYAATITILAGIAVSNAGADDIKAPAPVEPQPPPALSEPTPRPSRLPPDGLFLPPPAKRYKKRQNPFDNESDPMDESVSEKEREQLRKEDRDPTKYQDLEPGSLPKAEAAPSAETATDKPFPEPKLSDESGRSPRWNTGNGRALFHLGGSQVQTIVSGLRAEHTIWNSLTFSARAEGEIDLLRDSNNYSAAGGMAWRLFRPLTLTAEGGAGGATFASWTQFGGGLSLLLEGLFAERLDTRITLRTASGTGTLGSIDQQATLLGFTSSTFGVTLSQALSQSVNVTLEADFGSYLDANGIDMGTVRSASDTDVRQEATHLAQAALSRRFAPMEGSFASTRWSLAVGFRAGNDMRISLEAGQMLSGLAANDTAAWWAFSPKIETDLSPRTALQLEALWAPLISASAEADPIFPSDLILGRIGLRLLWP